MQRNNNSIIWNPGELIYEIGSIPEEAYLILEGYVNIETQELTKTLKVYGIDDCNYCANAKELLENYLSSFYVEKLYRSNQFFNEKYIMTYTHTGLVRNVINEMYFTDDDLITH